jgi:hypothetical protein
LGFAYFWIGKMGFWLLGLETKYHHYKDSFDWTFQDEITLRTATEQFL